MRGRHSLDEVFQSEKGQRGAGGGGETKKNVLATGGGRRPVAGGGQAADMAQTGLGPPPDTGVMWTRGQEPCYINQPVAINSLSLKLFVRSRFWSRNSLSMILS